MSLKLSDIGFRVQERQVFREMVLIVFTNKVDGWMFRGLAITEMRLEGANDLLDVVHMIAPLLMRLLYQRLSK